MPSEPRPEADILIVDDNLDAAQALAMWLEMEGNTVVIRQSGPEALETARTVKPRAAVLDIGLPGMSGLEVAEALRRELGQSIVLVALTGLVKAEDRQRSLDAGFDHHLTKPVDPSELSRLIAAPRPETTAR